MLSLTVLGVQSIHKLEVGAVLRLVPLADQHDPLDASSVRLTLQDAVVPPFDPTQDQVVGFCRTSDDTVPAVQVANVDGSFEEETVVQFAGPHTQLMAEIATLHVAVTAFTLRSPRFVYDGQ